jgi:multidrug efflux system membrane fusion protein
MVKAGQVLARLDPGDSTLSAAAAAAQLDLAAADLQRFRNLQARTSSARRRSMPRRPPSRRRRHRLNWPATRPPIRFSKPIRRGSSARHGEVGQVVAAGQTVMRLARADTLEVAISIPEARMPELRALGVRRVSLWADHEASYPGTLRECRRLPTRSPAPTRHACRSTIRMPGCCSG